MVHLLPSHTAADTFYITYTIGVFHVTYGCHMFTSHMVVTCYDMFRQLQTTVYCTLQCFSLCLAISDRLEQTLSHMTQVKDIGPK